MPLSAYLRCAREDLGRVSGLVQQASQLLDRLEQATLSKAFRDQLVPKIPTMNSPQFCWSGDKQNHIYADCGRQFIDNYSVLGHFPKMSKKCA
ncbi:MAG: hypothetical protein LVT47_02925 [Cyanobacteria bacterium LVE1205-1]